jgi:tryptophanyl-tRNA synthetase
LRVPRQRVVDTVELFAPENVLRKKIMGIKTDSTPVEAPKPVENSVILSLYKLVASAADYADMEAVFRNGGVGYGDLKKQLFSGIWEYFAPFRSRREELASDPGHVERVLLDGARKASDVAAKVLHRTRQAVGIGAP